MKKTALNLIAIAILATPAFAQKVNIDYAHAFDFSSVKTFQYVDTQESNIKGNEMMADRVVEMIKKDMRDGGLTEVQSNADIFLTYHFTSEERKSFNTTSMGYGGYGGYWDDWGGYGDFGYGGFGPSMGSSVTREISCEEGTLVIDAYDSKEKKMIWRGSGTVTTKEKPDKQIKQVENILKKLGKKWEKILAGKGK